MSNPHTQTDALTAPKRQFGAHLVLRWWVPIVLTLVVVIALYGLQFLFLAGAAIVEVGALGKDPTDTTLTPLTYLATNLAVITLAPITLLVICKAGGVPLKRLFAIGRDFNWRRLLGYGSAFAALMVAVNLVLLRLEPASLSAFAVTSTTVALLVIVLLTTPLQAASEEVVFRGALTASYASWLRATRPALITGIVLSTLLFAATHSSADPWMIVHYLGLGGSTAIMALIARGLEPAIAFHVMNNVFSMGVGAFFTNGGGIPQDRTFGSAGPSMLLFLAAQALAVLGVWWFERRRGRDVHHIPRELHSGSHLT